LLFIQKYVHHRSKLPAVFSTYFEENNLLHCHDTRQKTISTRMLCSLKLGKRLLDIRAVSYGTIYLMTSKRLHHYYLLNID